MATIGWHNKRGTPYKECLWELNSGRRQPPGPGRQQVDGDQGQQLRLPTSSGSDDVDLIRLLRVRELDRGRVVCELKVFSLHSAPAYCALSYSWGAQPAIAEVILETDGKRQNLGISVDLEQALITLATDDHTSYEGWLWVDALCINQVNSREKSDQVRRMRMIFQKAACTIVWLGGEVTSYKHTMPDPSLDGLYFGPGFHVWKLAELVNKGSAVWWRRLWVIQEIAVSRNIEVLIGPHKVSWNDFVEAFCGPIKRLARSTWRWDRDTLPLEEIDIKSAISQIQRLDQLRNALRHLPDGEELSKLIRMTSTFDASVAHDKIYGLLGLAPASAYRAISINYECSLRTLFAQVVAYFVKSTGSLEVLTQGWPRGKGLMRDKLQGATMVVGSRADLFNPRMNYISLPSTATGAADTMLPTWMPDFSRHQRTRVRYPTSCFGASADELHDIRIQSDRLIIEAINLGSAVSLLRLSKLIPEDAQRSHMNTTMQAFIAALAARDLQKLQKHGCSKRALGALPPFRRVSALDLGWADLGDDLSEAHVLVTEQGLTAVSLDPVQAGDIIVMAMGARTPWIIRPLSTVSARTNYTLVDACYVGAAACNNLMEWTSDGQLRPQKIILE